LVSEIDGQLVASHYPFLLEPDNDDLTVVTHLGRPDDRVHGIGNSEVLLILQGYHGYISPSWYAPGEVRAPTWNFTVAHCYGVPEVLDPENNLKVLTRLVERIETPVENPMFLDPEYAQRIIKGTVGIRIPISRFLCKVKLSPDKQEQSQQQIVAELRAPGPYEHHVLADDMERVRSGSVDL
jgi:transcriptional regulator